MGQNRENTANTGLEDVFLKLDFFVILTYCYHALGRDGYSDG